MSRIALLLNPDQLHHVRKHASLIRGAVEELLRFVDPVEMINCYAREDLEIGGVPIPRGSHVQIVLAAAAQDPAFVPNADQLDVTRPLRQHLAFRQGIHYCRGAALARLEGDIGFTTLLRRLPNLRLAIPSGEVRRGPGVEIRGLENFPVLF